MLKIELFFSDPFFNIICVNAKKERESNAFQIMAFNIDPFSARSSANGDQGDFYYDYHNRYSTF